MYRLLNSPLVSSPSLALRRSLSNLLVRHPSQPTRQLSWTSHHCRRPVLSVEKSPVTLLVQCRNIGGPKTVAKLFMKDRLDPEKFEMIYRADFTTYFLWCQWGLLAAAATFAIIGVEHAVFTFFPELKPKPSDDGKPRSFGGYFIDMDKLEREREVLNEQHRDMAYDYLYLDKYIKDFGENTGWILSAVAIVLISAIAKLMRMVPVRIYSSLKNPDQCVAAHFSYFIPGRMITRELQAGTLVTYYKKQLLPITNNVYKDSKGNPYLLYSRFFRSTSEYYRLLSEETRSRPLVLSMRDERPGDPSKVPDKINWKQLRAQAQRQRQIQEGPK